MKNFSKESLLKYRLLNFLLPVLGYVMTRKSKSLMLIDAHAGPGFFSDETGCYPGSPVLFYNAASMLAASTRLAMIDRDPIAYDRLFRLMYSLPDVRNVRLQPILGTAEHHIAKLVDMAGTDPTLIFTDPCEGWVPEPLATVADRKNVTILMRYGAVGAWRSKKEKEVLSKFKRINMPYWRYNAGDPDGQHKYRMLLGTHDRQVAEACGNCLVPISGPTDPVVLA